MHAFGNSGVGKNTLGQFMLSGFELLGYTETLNLFCDLWADHMSAKQFTGIFIEDGFDQSFSFVNSQSFTIGIQVKAPHTNAVSGGFGLSFGETNAGDLWAAVSTAGHLIFI